MTSIDPDNPPPEYWDEIPGGRPSEQADRVEMLFVLGYRPDGSVVPPAYLPYGRDDLGRPTWRDWDGIEEMPDVFDIGGLVYDAWRQGLAEPPGSLRGLLLHVTSLVGGGMPMAIFDPVIAAQLAPPNN